MSAGQENHAPATPPPGGHPASHPEGHPASRPASPAAAPAAGPAAGTAVVQPGPQPPQPLQAPQPSRPSRRQMLRGAERRPGCRGLNPGPRFTRPARRRRGWSNYYDKAKTANLLAVSVSNLADWVSVTWPSARAFDSVQASFTISATLAQPASVTVSYWDGTGFVPAANLQVSRATASDQPTTLTFDPVRSSRVRLDMTSAAPGTGAGFLQIVELRVLSGGTAVT